MRWKPRRNGGNSNRTRMSQSMQSTADTGWASGHHSYPKGHGGGNRTGAISHAPKEWGSKARKEEEHMTMLAKQAEMDAIREGLEAAEPVKSVCEVCDHDHYPDDETGWELALAGNPYILLDGQYVPDDDDWEDDDPSPYNGNYSED